MRKFAYHLTLKVMLLIGLVMTTVAYSLTMTQTSGGSYVHPTWMSNDVGSTVVTSGAADAAPVVVGVALVMYWTMYLVTRRGVRKMFPREAY